jgi:hypothetical protein
MLLTQVTGIAGVAVVAAGLWVWGYSEVWAESAQRVPAGLWACRSLAVGMMALGQVLFAWWVVPHLFSRAGRFGEQPGVVRGYFEQVVTLVAGLTWLIATVCALALAAAAGWGG